MQQKAVKKEKEPKEPLVEGDKDLYGWPTYTPKRTHLRKKGLIRPY